VAGAPVVGPILPREYTDDLAGPGKIESSGPRDHIQENNYLKIVH